MLFDLSTHIVRCPAELKKKQHKITASEIIITGSRWMLGWMHMITHAATSA